MYPVILLLLISACGVSGQSNSDLQSELTELKKTVSSMQKQITELRNKELKLFKQFLDGTKGDRGQAGPPGPPGPPHGNSSTDWEYVMDQTPLRSCGGFITLHGNSQKVVHQLPKGSNYEETCVWVIWGAYGGPIDIKLDPNSAIAPLDSKSFLTVSLNYTTSGSYSSKLSPTYTSKTVNFPFAVVFFRGNSSSSGKEHGVEFQVTDRGQRLSEYQVKMVTLDWNSPTHSYKFPPAPLTKYGPNERLFVLVRGAVGMLTNVNVTNIDTESCCDFLLNPEYKQTGDGSMVVTMKSGQGVLVHRPTLRNEPFVMYFHSDSSEEKTGFSLSYFYTP